MSDEMKNDVIDFISNQAMDHCNSEKEMATFIKENFKSLYGGTWHCVVGRNFGSFVTFEKNFYIYLYIG